MSPLDILTAARDRARYTWDPGNDPARADEGKHVDGIMRYVAWADWSQDTSSWSDAWGHLYDALPGAEQREYGSDGPFYADEAVDGWTSRTDRTLSEVMALFDIAIRAAS